MLCYARLSDTDTEYTHIYENGIKHHGCHSSHQPIVRGPISEGNKFPVMTFHNGTVSQRIDSGNDTKKGRKNTKQQQQPRMITMSSQWLASERAFEASSQLVISFLFSWISWITSRAEGPIIRYGKYAATLCSCFPTPLTKRMVYGLLFFEQLSLSLSLGEVCAVGKQQPPMQQTCTETDTTYSCWLGFGE